MSHIEQILYSDTFWAAGLIFAFIALAVGILADLCKKPKRDIY